MTIKYDRTAMGVSVQCDAHVQQVKLHSGKVEDRPFTFKYPFIPCEHIDNFIDTSGDVNDIDSSSSIWLYASHKNKFYLPSISWLGWTRIDIGPELKGGFREVNLNHDRSNSTKLKAELGLLNPGEGRLVLCSMVMDYVRGMVHPTDNWLATKNVPLKTKCKSAMHKFSQEKRKLEYEKFPDARHKMMVALVLEGACIPCLEDAYGEKGEEPENFGVDPSAMKGNGTAKTKPTSGPTLPQGANLAPASTWGTSMTTFNSSGEDEPFIKSLEGETVTRTEYVPGLDIYKIDYGLGSSRKMKTVSAKQMKALMNDEAQAETNQNQSLKFQANSNGVVTGVTHVNGEPIKETMFTEQGGPMIFTGVTGSTYKIAHDVIEHHAIRAGLRTR